MKKLLIALAINFVLMFNQSFAESLDFSLENNKWLTISVGGSIGGLVHVMGIREDGSLWTWGSNWRSQLGTGSKSDEFFPVQIGNDNDWLSVYTGWYHTLALKKDGTIWSWGYNEFGQLGTGDLNIKSTPLQIGSESDWKIISAKYDQSFAIKSDGTLWAWGKNNGGQLGDGTTTNRNVPLKVSDHIKFKNVDAGEHHTLAIADDGTLWAWGGNGYSQLGNDFGGNSLVPIKIDNSNNWKQISGGMNHSLALKKNKTLWAFGNNVIGVCGNGNMDIFQSTPAKVVDNRQDYVFISAGQNYSAGIKSDGTLWVFGLSTGGLGDVPTGGGNQIAPVQMGKDEDWANVACGHFVTFGIKKDGSLWVWGIDMHGSFGMGDRKNANHIKPVQIK